MNASLALPVPHALKATHDTPPDILPMPRTQQPCGLLRSILAASQPAASTQHHPLTVQDVVQAQTWPIRFPPLGAPGKTPAVVSTVNRLLLSEYPAVWSPAHVAPLNPPATAVRSLPWGPHARRGHPRGRHARRRHCSTGKARGKVQRPVTSAATGAHGTKRVTSAVTQGGKRGVRYQAGDQCCDTRRETGPR